MVILDPEVDPLGDRQRAHGAGHAFDDRVKRDGLHLQLHPAGFDL
jgi:hypothetical protein